MANFPVFKLHHKKAGAAADSGDHQLAMHHVGKMLSALRSAGTAPTVAPVDDQPAPVGLRARLARMKTPLANSSGGM